MKKRFKLHKSGKLWLCSAITFTSLAIGTATLTGSVHADVEQAQTTVTSQTYQTNQQSVESTLKVSSNVNDQITNQVPVDTQVSNNNVDANQGSLDRYQFNTDATTGQSSLQVNGWHATGHSNAQRYRWAILYDNTTQREINRQKITPVFRPDVQQAQPHIANAQWSGFNINFQLPNSLSSHSISLISRYSSDLLNGEGQHTDYWFNPIILNSDNRATLDELDSDQEGNLHVAGWHATNQAMGKKYHYLIVFDQTHNREITRQLTSNGRARPDVAGAFPNIVNAGISGFSADFKLNPLYARDKIQFISRWTNDPTGNGQAVDYWFGPVNKQNRGNLDSWNLSSGNLKVAGWHANDASIYEPYHYLIVFDNTTGNQVTTKRVTNNASGDVAKIYSDTRTANRARFDVDLGSLNLTAGHTYSLISRYSSYNGGNGDDGNGADYTDYWFPAQTFNHSAYSIDRIKANGQSITINGWFANDSSVQEKYPYVIFLMNGQEVGRQRVGLTGRPDVGEAYPQIYNSAHSGFSAIFDMPENVTGDFQFVLRYSDQLNGEGNHVDIWTPGYATNAGNYDRIQVNRNTLDVSGWHASVAANRKPYQYIIIVDADNGHEYVRKQVYGLARPDVKNVYPWINGAENSGLNITIDNASFNHHNIKIIHRFTDDPAGNGSDTVDFYSDVIPVHSWYKINKATYHMNDDQQIDYVLNDAPAICQRPNLPTGCEMTAVTMMLQYAGVNISKEQVANETPKSNNAYTGFMGNPYSNSGYGLWVAPSGIASVVARHLGNVLNMTGWGIDSIKSQLINRHLVVVWQAHMHGFGTHAITLTGFDGGGFFYNDPWTGQKNAHMTYGTFDWNWRDDPASRGALSY